jgi:histidine phosphotransferase ChpT
MTSDARFAQTLSARLCHDLGGAVATLVGTLDMVDAAGDDMLALSRETALALRQRLKLYAAAWAGPANEANAETLAGLLAGAPAAARVRFACEGLAPGAILPAPLVPLALNAALLAAEALPRGGTVHLSGAPATGLAFWPEGRNAAWPAPLLALLAGTPPAALLEGGPRLVLAPLLGLLAAELGWQLSLEAGAEATAPTLLLAPA